jgi:PTH1 family peptidyl-tRNA hydrolase
MWLIAGLGNPGAEYAATRHNIGFMAVDRLAAGGNFSNKFQGEVATITFGDEKLVLLKPLTYMNNSGRSLQAAMAFYKLPPAQLIVLHDELDLPLGKLRIKKAGGANGHNGIKDIDAAIGPDYWRVRLGIGHPGDKNRVHDYVLGRFNADERTLADKTTQALAEHLPLFWQRSPEVLASHLAAALNPPRPKPPKEQEPNGL